MDFSEFFGFLISVGALLFLFLWPLWQAFSRKRNPEKYAEEEKAKQKRLQKLLKTLDIEPEEEEDDEDEEIAEGKLEEEPESQRMGHRSPALENKALPSHALGYHYEGAHLGVGPTLFVTPRRTTQKLTASTSNAYTLKSMAGGGSKGLRLVKTLRSPKEMIVIREIIGPPRSFTL